MPNNSRLSKAIIGYFPREGVEMEALIQDIDEPVQVPQDAVIRCKTRTDGMGSGTGNMA